MTALEIIILVAAVGIVVGVIVWNIVKKKRGKGGCCGCDCSSCCAACRSAKNGKKELTSKPNK